MKKLMFLFATILIFFSCEKYEFDVKEKNMIIKTQIQIKNLQGDFVGMDTAKVTVGTKIIFKAVTLGGYPTKWSWDFGDGQTAQGQQVDHFYHKAGVYEVTVTVNDENGFDVSTIIIVVIELTQDTVFCGHLSYLPNNQGQIKYIVSGSKKYIPNPPVSESGPFGYEGSNPESSWNVIKISPDTSSTRVYWEVLTYNDVYSQAYGGFDNNNLFVWADMQESRFYSSSYNSLRVGFLNGELVEEENFQSNILGNLGDDGDNPEIRFEVIENEDKINVYINIFNYSQEINWPQARFKIDKEDSWSVQHETEWVGGTGYVKYVVPINSAGEYRLRIEPDKNNPGTYTKMSNSKFYNSSEDCFIWYFADLSD
jgi:PKD repeat protein